MRVCKKRMEEEINRKIENEKKETETDSRNWMKLEEIVIYERRRYKEDVGNIGMELEEIKDAKVMSEVISNKEIDFVIQITSTGQLRFRKSISKMAAEKRTAWAAVRISLHTLKLLT